MPYFKHSLFAHFCERKKERYSVEEYKESKKSVEQDISADIVVDG